MTCFCEHHQKAARERGINFERAREGFLKLDQFVQASLKDKRPTDGYFVMLRRSDCIELKMSVDEALKYVVSMGVVVPGGPVANPNLIK